MPGPPFKSLQSAAAAPPFFFFVALPNSIFAFGFQFAIAIGHAKSVNYTTLAAPLAGVWRSKLRQIVIVVPPSSGLALSYALRQPPPPPLAAGVLRFLQLTSATSAERANGWANQFRANHTQQMPYALSRLIAAPRLSHSLCLKFRVFAAKFILHKCGGEGRSCPRCLGQLYWVKSYAAIGWIRL